MVKSMRCQWLSRIVPAVFLVQMLLILGGCKEVDDPVCDGVVDLEAVVASKVAVDAFRSHIGKADGDTEMARFFGDYRNYDLRIDATESKYIYEFIPRTVSRAYKGGGARYLVDRSSGKIAEAVYFK